MPSLSSLKITHFRNLASVAIHPEPGINLIAGPNGSGKTSMLEAISVLAHGRSFRTHKFRRLIQDEHPDFTVFAELQSGTRMGINRGRQGQNRARIDGNAVKSSGELAQALPVQVIDAHSFSLLEGSAKKRRMYFDWLVFHVKHKFRDLWKAYVRGVKQRNSLLRRDKINYSDLAHWDKELVALAVEIDALRQECVPPLLEAFNKLIGDCEFADKLDLVIAYQRGWKTGEGEQEQGEASPEALLKLYEQAYPRDRKLGYTTIGPHKSDLKITVNNIPAVEVLSRGQQKAVINALYMAEASVYAAERQSSPVFLLDDMPSELDKNHIQILSNWLNRLACQVFITGVDAQLLADTWPAAEGQTLKLFHVKHGEVRVSDHAESEAG